MLSSWISVTLYLWPISVTIFSLSSTICMVSGYLLLLWPNSLITFSQLFTWWVIIILSHDSSIYLTSGYNYLHGEQLSSLPSTCLSDHILSGMVSDPSLPIAKRSDYLFCVNHYLHSEWFLSYPMTHLANYLIWLPQFAQFLFGMILYPPTNNFSVIKGRVFLGWTSTKLGLMFLHSEQLSSLPMTHLCGHILISLTNLSGYLYLHSEQLFTLPLTSTYYFMYGKWFFSSYSQTQWPPFQCLPLHGV